MRAMHIADLHRRRLRNQRLIGDRLASAEAVVGWLAAVQSQEYAYAKWSVGQRVGGPNVGLRAAHLDELVTRGVIVRTHILRPTWHFVAATDLRWMMALSGPRVDARNGPRYRQLELDEATLAPARDVIRGGLAGGRRLTRPQIGELLAAAGIDVGPPYRREAIVMHAELNLVVCSGGFEGRLPTYTLVDEVVPVTEPLAEDEALARLVRRYFASHGPATVADFSWWSGLKVSDARRGIEIAGAQLESIDVDGTTFWQAADSPATTDDQRAIDSATASLLQSFDEMVVGYQRTRTVALDPNSFSHPLLVDGAIVGRWRLTRDKSAGFDVEMTVEAPLDGRQQKVFDAEVSRCRAFYAST
jgi:hypothetical protein